MLALHHSSLASLYFETYQSTDLFPGLGEDVKERITEQSKDDGWERGLFYLYLKSEPTNLLDVLALADWEKIKEGLTLLEDNEIKESIKQLIEKEDLIAINGMVEYITNKSRVVASKFVNCIFDTLVSKIEDEEDIEKIGAFVRDIIKSEIREAARRLVDGINIDRLLLKIDEEEDIQKIGALVQDIVRIGRIEVAGKLVEGINIDALLPKMEKEKDIEKIGAFVRNIVWSKRKDVIREVVNRLNPELKEELYKTVWWKAIKAGIS
jgi:hypothetical protein